MWCRVLARQFTLCRKLLCVPVSRRIFVTEQFVIPFREVGVSTSKMAANFELVCSAKANGVIPVDKYRSNATGLTVCIAQVEGPLVKGYFCLATEAHDDDGLPHTLEHLVFMGSEDYPYKGVLDLLANRCLAQGTNAWTDTDHTAYTVTTAGSQGFLNLLPIYLDHVLYPTLTDSAYITEVHHVNGEGEDAGVVYCEMQARENTGESRTYLEMLRSMYPGHCGYKSETGGMLENLRTSTSHKKVVDYHKSFYRPENLYLVITGQVKASDVFQVLEPFEKKILSKGSLPPYKRPWQNPIPPLPASVTHTVQYPSDDEANGMVRMAWRGPKSDELYDIPAIATMLEYMTDTAIAPLQRELVEIEDPYCNRVSHSLIENAECCVYLHLSNVPSAKLRVLKDKVLSVLKGIAEGTEKLDMERMGTVVHRQILQALNHIEDQPHDTVAFHCIGDFLYGTSIEQMTERLNNINYYRRLAKEPLEFWTNLLKKYFTQASLVTIIGEPSTDMRDDMAEEEKQRIEAQREELGETGLRKVEKMLDKATEDNEKEAPTEMLSSLDVPDTDTIQFHPIKTASTHDKNAMNRIPQFPLDGLPFTFMLDHIHTNFVQLCALLDSSRVPQDLRPYLCLYIEVILESPVLRDGVFVSHEDVIRELAADTLTAESSLGVGGNRFACGHFAQVVTLALKLEMEKYTKGVQWLRELLFQTQFTVDRLKIIATKMANDVARQKRSGAKVASTIINDMNFQSESNIHASNMMRQHKFLTELLEKLEGKPDKVLEKMNQLRALLTDPASLRVHMSADVQKLAGVGSPRQPWDNFISKERLSEKTSPSELQHSYNLLKPLDKVSAMGTIVGVGAVESSFLVQTVPGITSHSHPDLAAILVFIEYLTALEGPMWRQIRGLGLSYHYSIKVTPSQGLMSFILYKSAQLVQAYKVGKDIVDEYLDGSSDFEPVQVEAAISSVLSSIIEREESVGDTSMQSLLSYFRGVGSSYNRDLLAKISKVTVSDLKRVGAEYFTPLFDPSKARVSICCNPSKVEETKAGFEEQLVVMESLEEAYKDED
ncbi:Hypp4744 [Branchiostoma lanceolatum]|uniref:Pitrilysin metalloproteinase 1 n=1 Tax=Branchiostoma lanceolatum TaxID=7740 RepID=A0A8K0EZ86_BRALA|nr:Hypp4744 [Branchiostoma lanceolatum]